jgi:HD-GYP domain-containing protein (c-di-GMP phosphodiesterase class II)
MAYGQEALHYYLPKRWEDLMQSSYLPINIDKLIVGCQVNFDVYIYNPNKLSDQADYRVLFRKGYVIASAMINELRERNLNIVFFHQDDRDTVLEYLKWEPLNSEPVRPGSTSKNQNENLEEKWSVVKVQSGLDGEESKYISLFIDSIIPDSKISFNAYVKGVVSNGGKKEIKYVLSCQNNNIFSSELLNKLKQSTITKIYYHIDEQNMVLLYLTEKLNDLKSNNTLSQEEKAKLVYESTVIWTNNFFTIEKSRMGDQLALGLHLVEAMIDRVSSDFTLPNWIGEICKFDTFLYGHCVNVALLSLTFAKWLGWPQSEIRNLGITALIHDIGMTKIPMSIYNKETKLTQLELAVVQRHPKIGFELLFNDIALPINKRCLISILQHHENCDGSGYPNKLKNHDIDQYAKLIRITDSYEAMTAKRRWRTSKLPKEALWEILDQCRKSSVYDPHYFKEFVQFISK